MKEITLVLIYFNCLIVQLNAQQFNTMIQAESHGFIDSVKIGFDSSASIEVDKQFDELDISDQLFDSTFEIRTGQLDMYEFSCESYYQEQGNEFISYMSKIDILPKECVGWEGTETIGGLIPFTTIFIKNKDFPVLLKWDSSIFQNECLDRSLITDWNPGFWYDVTCSEISLDAIGLRNQDSIWINDKSDMILIDSLNDTISMFFVLLGNDIINSVNEVTEESVNIYPNPTNKIINIETESAEIELIEIYSSEGELVFKSKESISYNLENFSNGYYYIRILTNESSIIKKVFKYSQ